MRACICSGLSIFASLIFRKSDMYNNLGISLIYLIIQNPFCVFDLGLILSYLGTIGILISLKEERKDNIKENHKEKKAISFLKKIQEGFFLCIKINLILLPILICSFHKISFAFLFSGIILTPLLTVILILGFMTILFIYIYVEFAVFLIPILNVLLSIFQKTAEIIASIPGIITYVITPKIEWIFVYYCFLFFVFFKRNSLKNKNRKRVQKINESVLKKWIVVLIILNLSITLYAKLNQDFEIHFLDVGQGDSCLIQTKQGKNILIDGGGNWNQDYNTGENVLMPYLLNNQINRIDILIITHFDLDHCQGAIFLLEQINVEKVIISKQYQTSDNFEEFARIVKEKKISVEWKSAGDKIEIDRDVSIEFLWPTDNLETENALNNNSLVFKLKYKEFSVLFTGDIEEIVEKKLVGMYKNDELRADVLKVAHHGSKTSSTIEFLEKVNPKVALIGVGENNQFGHPNEEVIDRFKNLGTKVYRTDQSGEISITIKNKGSFKVKKFIQQKKINNDIIGKDN